MKNINAAWVDTGFLVALFAQDDPLHQSATKYLQSLAKLELYSILPVVVEACFFLDTRGKDALLRWIERGAMTLGTHQEITYPLGNVGMGLSLRQVGKLFFSESLT